MLICVTHRKLCHEPFLTRLERIASMKPYCIILREKDLSEHEYEALARECMAVCQAYGVPLHVNTYINIARKIGCNGIHLPFPLFMKQKENLSDFSRIGVSVHSAEEAAQLKHTCATYIQAGHIFPTDCKAGLPPRGLDYLSAIASAVDIPVFGIGGITAERYPAVLKTGAAGACMMSGLMTCDNVEETMQSFL